MQTPTAELRPHLQAFDFPRLFVEGLGWNHYQAEPLTIQVNEREYSLKPVAEKANFAVFECSPGPGGLFPEYPVRRKIETQVAKLAFEHLIIFIDAARTQQKWQWVKREAGKPVVCREQDYRAGQGGEPVLQRLREVAFDLDDEARGVSISDVTGRMYKAFDVEKVTKRFYDRFRTELTTFGKFIEGITAQGDRDWYASLMLNRMMFIYFVQKQGFLDGDPDYLRSRLKMVQALPGHPEPAIRHPEPAIRHPEPATRHPEPAEGRFQQFYRLFLLRLFHEGLGQPEAQRAPELAALLGRVPFLNGGLFDVHDLERDNPHISIPDAAFERVFDFFDGYRWHLDERPYREDNEINPDVLGYIFEKYVNQKQMGAYYTKEDITGYISRNTVIPFLFDAARKECPVAFGPDGGVWRLLREDPDRYIYPAVGHGIAWNARDPENPVRLHSSPSPRSVQMGEGRGEGDTPRELPNDIASGIDDVSRRGGWNAPAPDAYALPTETWREVVARRQRYAEVRAKLASGDVREINDIITLNLDIERFARDVIAQSEGPELLRAFWHAMRDVSVLDPTCGSGAFLFAALNVLEPLYTACLEGMRGFLDDLRHSRARGNPRSPNALSDFRDVLAQVEKHPSERYFILKSIVLNNLYGVDIMEEAVEICKLRLFLKLVAQLERYDQIEPLPDIDFNIRAGNTLVGFTSLDAVRQAMTVTPDGQSRMVSEEDERALARIEEKAEVADRQAGLFRDQQTTHGGEITADHKAELRTRLRALADELDRHLATEYGIDSNKTATYDAWRASHQPFHWFAEFYGIMSKGGFDVVIGNPPYVKYKSVGYTVNGLKPFKFPDIYGHVVIQAYRVKRPTGRCGMIVPLSLTFSYEFADLRKELGKSGTHWLSSYDNIPAALFAGVSQRCTILLSSSPGRGLFSTRLLRWRAPYRDSLMRNVAYSAVPDMLHLGNFGVPRVANDHGKRLLGLHIGLAGGDSKKLKYDESPPAQLGFSSTARNFLSTYTEKPPTVAGNGKVVGAGSPGYSLNMPSQELATAALAATSGSVCFWYWLTRGDGFHVTKGLLSDFLAPLAHLPPDCKTNLQSIGELLHEYRNAALVFKKNAGKYVGNYNYQAVGALTLRADLILLSGIGASWQDAERLLALVSMVRSINESAGEKNIPEFVKSQFPQPDVNQILHDERLIEVDKWLAGKYHVDRGAIAEMVNA